MIVVCRSGREHKTSGQRIHDLVPDSRLSPTNEATVTSSAGTIGRWQVARLPLQLYGFATW